MIDYDTGLLERTIENYPNNISELQQIEDYYLAQGFTVSFRYETINENGVEMKEILKFNDFTEACNYQGVQGLCIFVKVLDKTKNEPSPSGLWRCVRCMFDKNPDENAKCMVCNTPKPIPRGIRKIPY